MRGYYSRKFDIAYWYSIGSEVPSKSPPVRGVNYSTLLFRYGDKYRFSATRLSQGYRSLDS